jgi:hypothetical protein
MLPPIHSSHIRALSDSEVDALRAAEGDEALLHCQVSVAEGARQAKQSMLANRPDLVHEAAVALGISEEVSTVGSTSARSCNALNVGVTQQQQGDPDLVRNLGTLTVTGVPHSERDEQTSTAMLVDIDTPDDLRHADVVDEERRQLAKIEDQKRIADCPKSWTCLKCSVLNSHRSRSCDSCADKKPPSLLVARSKFPGPGRPRDEVKKNKEISHPTVKKSHKKKVYSTEEQLDGNSKPPTVGPLPTLNVKTEKTSTTTTTEVGLVIQPIKKSHKKKVVLSVPAEVTAATIPSQVKGTESTAIV